MRNGARWAGPYLFPEILYDRTDVAHLERTSPNSPRTAAAIEPLTMLGCSGVHAYA